MARPHRRRRPDRDHPHPAEAAGPRRHRRTRRRRRARAARTCSSTKTATTPDVVLIGTGSEVSVCVGGARAARGARVWPCASCRCRRGICSKRSPTTTASTVLPPAAPTLAVEAGVELRLGRVGRRVVAIDRFGESAPGDVVLRRVRVHTGERRRARALALLGEDDAMTSSVARLIEFGQSPWYDNLTRALATGGLRDLMAEHGIRGVTSNPTIFEKAMATGLRLRRAAARGRRRRRATIEAAYWDLVERDIADAADILRPTLRRARRPRRLRLDRGEPRSRARHRGHDRPGEGAVRRGSAGPT